jgi:uncharacterized protein with von Willebrand factor type A (vWA) domain
MNTKLREQEEMMQRLLNAKEVAAVEKEALRQQLLARFHQFMKRIGYPHFVGIPIGVHRSGPPAVVTPDRISIHFDLATKHIEHLDIYFAHELMHPVVHEFRAWHQHALRTANIAEDLHINSLLLKIWGLDVRKAPVPGIFDPKLGALPVIEICKQLDQKTGYRPNGDVWAPAATSHPELWKVAHWIQTQVLGMQDQYLVINDQVDLDQYWPVVPSITVSVKANQWPAIDLRQVLLSCFLLAYKQHPVFNDTHIVFGKKITPTKQLVHGFIPDFSFVGDAAASSTAAAIYLQNVYQYDDYIQGRLKARQKRYAVAYKEYAKIDREILGLKSRFKKVPRKLIRRYKRYKFRLLSMYETIKRLSDLAKFPLSGLLKTEALVLEPLTATGSKMARLGSESAKARLQKAVKRPKVRVNRVSRILRLCSRTAIKTVKEVVANFGALESLTSDISVDDSDMEIRRPAVNIPPDELDMFDRLEDMLNQKEEQGASGQKPNGSPASPPSGSGSEVSKPPKTKSVPQQGKQLPPDVKPEQQPVQGSGDVEAPPQQANSNGILDSVENGAESEGQGTGSGNHRVQQPISVQESSIDQQDSNQVPPTSVATGGPMDLQPTILEVPEEKPLKADRQEMLRRLRGTDKIDRARALRLVASSGEAVDMLLKMKHYANLFDTMLNINSSKPKDHSTSVETTFDYGANLLALDPSELALLNSHQLVFFKNLADHSLLQHTPIDNKKDPLALLIDVSGSMKGEKYSMVCGFAIALAKRMCRDKRGMLIVLFDDKVALEIETQGSINIYQLVQELLTAPTWGGTAFEPPLLAAVRWGKRRKFTRLTTVLLTDGYGTVSDNGFEIRGYKTVTKYVMVRIGISTSRAKHDLPRIQQEIFDQVIPMVKGSETKNLAKVGRNAL